MQSVRSLFVARRLLSEFSRSDFFEAEDRACSKIRTRGSLHPLPPAWIGEEKLEVENERAKTTEGV